VERNLIAPNIENDPTRVLLSGFQLSKPVNKRQKHKASEKRDQNHDLLMAVDFGGS
jgi:hypothetical protein